MIEVLRKRNLNQERMRPKADVSRPALPDAIVANQVQVSLFRAIFASDTEFATRWTAWRCALAQDPCLDVVSLQHIALLYPRLPLDQTDQLTNIIRDHRCRLWAKNQMVLHLLVQTLAMLHQAGISTLLLKGAALIAQYYPDIGTRPMGDFDVLVPQVQFTAAVRILEARGWKSIYPVEDFDPRFSHAITLKDSNGNLVDLHCHVLHLTPHADTDERFWAASVPIELRGIKTRSLCAADLILHLAVHGLRWRPNPSLRWIPDIAVVLKHDDVDWDRLVAMAQALNVSLSVTNVLEYLQKEGFASVPFETLEALRAIDPQSRERKLFELMTVSKLGRYLDTLHLHWLIMTYQTSEADLLAKLRLLPAYVAYRASSSGFQTWLDFVLRGSLLKHVLGKVGLYKTPAVDQRIL